MLSLTLRLPPCENKQGIGDDKDLDSNVSSTATGMPNHQPTADYPAESSDRCATPTTRTPSHPTPALDLHHCFLDILAPTTSHLHAEPLGGCCSLVSLSFARLHGPERTLILTFSGAVRRRRASLANRNGCHCCSGTFSWTMMKW